MVDNIRLEGFLRNLTYDYVPLLSTAVGLINLFYKCVILPYKDKSAIANNRYYTYLQQKSFLRCIVLLFPIVGNIAIGCYDLFHSKATAQTNVISSTERSPRSLTLTTDHSSSKRETQVPPSSPNASRQNHPRATTDQPVFAPLIPSSSRKESRVALSHPASRVDQPAENATPPSLAPTIIIPSSLPTSSVDISRDPIERYCPTAQPPVVQSNRAPRLSTTILPKSFRDSRKKEKTSYDKVPRVVLTQCIEFVGNALATSSVSKHFLYSSYDACQSIAKANKEIFSGAIITKPTNSAHSNVHAYWNPIKTLHSTCIDQARAVGIQVDSPQEVLLQTLMQQIAAEKARNFNLFFIGMLKQSRQQRLPLTREEEGQVISQLGLLCSAQMDDLEKAKQGRTWMQENQAILRKINTLELAALGLSHLPPEIGLFTQLKSLHLSQNQLKSLPREIGFLIALKHLTLLHNQLKSLPREIGKLTELEWLHVDNNQLKSLPQEIGFLIALKHLTLSYNQLKSLPREIGKLTELEWLSLGDNQLKSLPQEISFLTGLNYLDLSCNQLKPLPQEIRFLTALKRLTLSYNQLKSLPQEIRSLTGLEIILRTDEIIRKLDEMTREADERRRRMDEMIRESHKRIR